ncbi:CDP-diacylglycerol--glycerol-3-phosphate 3-phosphatidyltransferase [Prochlorococcus marinus]|uniref:CDP-diacylglycerol--glycerol-3-phosphate 3-phosphatidyltransferase n=1 Tax=Prochlorococcus marinus XMU1408 TaxID=2213228 RepID=A0A318RGL4_PROMR|nr:CDP-diacylglycerol--glycerol-3-phosphate 3-phosphatidyltransferase [Prochlorococcus marinus]MBW3041802.1 CDP-diacylglycerol--glycerol-3-phosphate 3-phosphatidyltransferase [Prochlorococcus marinus str. XMU1408]PYE02943.1 CDP-diacylglycerol--glycerol-3-phosphate 3-phosphatidyltransferase [Prochlorococcus marinus XMU1408]
MKKFINTKRLINWPIIINGLTISRIFLGLPIVFALVNGNNDIFILLILIGALTDFLDGYFARKYNYQSIIGARLDPLADKILLIGPMIWLVHENLVPLWSVWLILSREFLITSWRSDKKSGMPATIQGKVKTILQFISIILLLWPENWGSFYITNIINEIGYILFWISLFLTFSSAIKYLFNQRETHQK